MKCRIRFTDSAKAVTRTEPQFGTGDRAEQCYHAGSPPERFPAETSREGIDARPVFIGLSDLVVDVSQPALGNILVKVHLLILMY